ncbi:GNAT family N-acetyltransferase [Metabacillus rhizolycopersici]|uniref:GNAT family N-acetyltransferase n=1 Tax=Metabacillus rhizolycopersici TaxID=2875709 RepID=A0ABS7UP24_9BACI|nr:GNAT family N-acetyltransferase [Metabacillus rhizolycopersici]MBZ5750043.1 GNAT family N-acetyltransferase [Metabacillus rhizolycopersici]
MSYLIIRKSSPIETNMLLEMTLNVMSESSMGFVKNNPQLGLNVFVPYLNNGAYYLVAIDKTMIVGWVLIGPDFNPLNTQNTGSILSLYVFPLYRKKGVGKQLMIRAFDEFKKQGFQKIQLNVYADNPAKQLYKRLGFSDVSSVMEIELNEGTGN